jgi:hypothetical protein
MPKITIQFSRGKDKHDVLSVIRENGSRSWQHQQPGIPVHDLTHFAVESTLALADGFYGLLTQGWDITRLTDRDVRDVLPPEGMWTELVVGLVQAERTSPEPLSAADFNDLLEKEKTNFGLTVDRVLTEQELDRIRESFLHLFGKWRALKPGEEMTLEFDLPQKKSLPDARRRG